MNLKYAGFFPRAISLLIDGIVCGALWFYISKTAVYGKTLYMAIYSIWCIFFYSLFLFILYKYGCTPGKYILGIRVRKLNGEKAGLKEILKRCSVDIFLTTISTIGYLVAIYLLDFQHFLSLQSAERVAYVKQANPSWVTPIDIIAYVWVASELIVIFLNKKKRALHDFLGGTVVVHKNSISTN